MRRQPWRLVGPDSHAAPRADLHADGHRRGDAVGHAGAHRNGDEHPQPDHGRAFRHADQLTDRAIDLTADGDPNVISDSNSDA